MYAVVVSGCTKRSFSQNNALAVRRPVIETTLFDVDSTQLRSGAIVGMTAAANAMSSEPNRQTILKWSEEATNTRTRSGQ